jgi:hypothetical protein
LISGRLEIIEALKKADGSECIKALNKLKTTRPEIKDRIDEINKKFKADLPKKEKEKLIHTEIVDLSTDVVNFNLKNTLQFK